MELRGTIQHLQGLSNNLQMSDQVYGILYMLSRINPVPHNDTWHRDKWNKGKVKKNKKKKYESNATL